VPHLNVKLSKLFPLDMSVPSTVKINGEKNDQSGLSGRLHSGMIRED
jgi:hypothetical protein